MKRIKGWQASVILILLALILAEMAITSNVRANLRIREEGYMNHNWTVTVNDTVYNDVDLDSFSMPFVTRGDVITLDGRMTYKQIVNPTLRLYIEFAETHVFLEGEEIFSYGEERYEKNLVMGYGRFFINLDEDYQGKNIKIVYKVAERNGVTQLEAPVLCDGSTAQIDMLKDCGLVFGIDVFLIVFGLATIMVSLILLVSNSRVKEIVCIGFFSVCMGVWSICEQNIMPLFVNNFVLKTYIEYIAVFFAPMFVVIYFGIRAKGKMGHLWKSLYRIAFSLYIVSFAMAFALYFVRVIHFTQLLPIINMITIFIGLFILIFSLFRLRGKDGEYMAFCTGMCIMCIFAIVDIFRFTFINFASSSNGVFNGTSSLGAFVLVCAMLFDIANTVSEQICRKGKMELYEQLAYNDFLTGLANRRQCELMLDQIEEEKTPYAIVSLDINGLKETNDKFGHDEGDALLRDFSKIMMDVFGKVGTVGRMGGDEFIVIIRNADIYNIEQLFDQLDEKCAQVNKDRKNYKLVAARGICMRHEGHSTIREALREADRRMYVNKAELKENKGNI